MSSDVSGQATISALADQAARTPARYPRWVAAVVIVGAFGVMSLAYAALFSPGTMLAAGQHMNEAAKVWARYAAAYSTSLGITLLVLVAAKTRRLLAGVLIQAALAELLLAVVGVADRRWEQVPADIILIAAFGLCARALCRTTTETPS